MKIKPSGLEHITICDGAYLDTLLNIILEILIAASLSSDLFETFRANVLNRKHVLFCAKSVNANNNFV